MLTPADRSRLFLLKTSILWYSCLSSCLFVFLFHLRATLFFNFDRWDWQYCRRTNLICPRTINTNKNML